MLQIAFRIGLRLIQYRFLTFEHGVDIKNSISCYSCYEWIRFSLYEKFEYMYCMHACISFFFSCVLTNVVYSLFTMLLVSTCASLLHFTKTKDISWALTSKPYKDQWFGTLMWITKKKILAVYFEEVHILSKIFAYPRLMRVHSVKK